MAQRKIKIIDTGMQLPLVFKTVAFFILGAVVPLLLFTWHLKDTGEKIEKTADELNRAVKIEKDIVQAFAVFSRESAGEKAPLLPAYNTIVKDHQKAVSSIDNHILHLRQLHVEKERLFYIIAGWLLCMMVFLMVYLLRFSHRIAGPVHVMGKAMRELNEGRIPLLRPLRKGDLCQSLYTDFNSLVVKIEKNDSGKTADEAPLGV